MSQQVWGMKMAQDLVRGDLIPDLGKEPYALEVSEVQEMEGKMWVKCYKGLYQRLSQYVFVMKKLQHVLVCKLARTH